MNATEAVQLCRYVKACCPQQAIDEYTPQIWADKLADIQFHDARLAVANLTDQQPFIAIAEIKTEVRRIRAARIKAHGDPIPPAGLTPAEEITWRQEAWKTIGDGHHVPGRGIHHPLDHDKREALEEAR